MKKMKKIFALLIAMVMVLGMSTMVFAQTASPTTADADNATITVNNPAKGETYTLYKLFDATVDGAGKIAYQGTIPTSLSAYFEVITGADGSTNYVKLKAGADESALFTALETWATSATATVSAVSDGSVLTFTGLPYGYYVMTTTHKDTTTGKAAITVDSTNPNATINDKNETKVVAEEKKANGESFSIGDTITFTAKFITTNYVGSGETAGQVYKYVISDTLPEYLSDVAITSITIGGTAWADAPSAFTNKQITIPWVDEAGASLYANGAEIVVTYTAKLTSTVNVNAANKNTITITPFDKNDEPFEETDSTSDEITTYATALKKTDGTKALACAKFAFYGLTVEKTADGIYTVVSYDATAYDTTEGATQDTTKLGTEMEVGSDGKLYIVGLGENVTLKGVETVAPDGYNKLETEVTLTPQILTKEVYKATETRYYDADGNLVSTQASSTTSKEVEKNLSELDAKGVEVINNAGTELPSTGGIGTTIFYIIGAILVIGAGVVLVTRRRMNVQ
jgi:fimbrial isopeptide formation D2 family protein/LPXTG-motif cell wall-anchored protein